MKTGHLVLGCAGLCFAGLLAFSFWHTNRVSVTEYERYKQQLLELRELNAIVDGDVLKARFRALDNYDRLSRYGHEMAARLEAVQQGPRFLTPEEQRALRERVEQVKSLWDAKIPLIDRFISRNAVLNNSLQYFPNAGREVVSRLADSPGGHSPTALVNGLMREVLVYSLTPEAERAAAIQRCGEDLRKWISAHPEHEEARSVRSLLSHAEVIVSHTPRVDGLVRDILGIPVDERVLQLAEQHQAAFSTAYEEAMFHKKLLYACCAVLLLLVVGSLAALVQTNRKLEVRVRERTRELASKNEQLQQEMTERQQIQAQLVETSRLAGMAEVATGVLHNVGNVLNSVNVSANLISDYLRHSKIPSLSKAAALLRQHDDNLHLFLTQDDRGRQLPGYLATLAQHFADEQNRLLVEVGSLRKNVEHIKDIVAVQQNYAKISGTRERVNVLELIEDSIRMQAAAMERHCVQITREFQDVPCIVTDKHKVMQILVNLLKNAKTACSEARNDGKKVTIRVAQVNGRIQISIIDNGIGIPPENLVRVFSHGFTTRKDGHGFGLHTSAVAAKELGGCLIADSPGARHGARFTLELPIEDVA